MATAVKEKEDKKHSEKNAEKLAYGAGDLVVYPTHGVGKILGGRDARDRRPHAERFRRAFRQGSHDAARPGRQSQELRPPPPVDPQGDGNGADQAQGPLAAKRTMWSRRAQEYEAKINSGDPGSIAEVVRDLYRNASQPEQSYSERQIYQAALDRLVREFAAVEKIEEDVAVKRVEQMLSAAA